MIYNSSLISLSVQYSLQSSPFFILPVMLMNSQFYFNFFSYKNIYSSIIRSPAHSCLFFSNSQFSYLLSPAIYLTNENENTIIRDKAFHEKQYNFTSGITIINCELTYCSPVSGEKINDGGTIAINSDIPLVAKYCIFRQNSAHGYGGAISVEQSHLVKIEGCLIAENSAQSNGALYIRDCGKIDMKQSNFTLNKAKTSVGAASLRSISDGFDISFCILSENSARMSGTLYIFASMGNIDDCSFYNNDIFHGASSIKALNNVTVKIRRTIFSEKSPAVSFAKKNDVEIIKCRFANPQNFDIEKVFDVKIIVSEDNEFNSNLSYNKIELPPLKPLYDNDEEFKIVENDRKQINEKRYLRKPTPIIRKTLDPDHIPNDKEEESSPFSSLFTILAFLIIVASLIFLFIGKKREAHRGFANLNQQNNSILNECDLDDDHDMADIKFETNDDDLPDLQMEKY